MMPVASVYQFLIKSVLDLTCSCIPFAGIEPNSIHNISIVRYVVFTIKNEFKNQICGSSFIDKNTNALKILYFSKGNSIN